MTTIAYKDGIIACDSQATNGQTIVDDNYDKRITVKSVTFVYCGGPAYIKEFITAYFSEKKEIDNDNPCAALVIDDGELYFVCGENGKICSEPLSLDKPYALGSGQDHAWTAMDMGASAIEAVEMAIRRDIRTGGKVRTVTVE